MGFVMRCLFHIKAEFTISYAVEHDCSAQSYHFNKLATELWCPAGDAAFLPDGNSVTRERGLLILDLVHW